MRRLPLIVGLGLIAGASVGWAVTGDATRHVSRHLALWAVALGGYGLALRAARGISPRGLRVALLVALACRLPLAFGPPLLSDDVYRYVWEGRIQRHGGNPYVFADRPAAEKWSALRDGVWAGVNWKEYGAIYPPLWQLAARAVVGIHDSVVAMKLFLVACEVGAWGLLGAALRRRGRPRERLLIAALSPLALVEIAGSGHNEALGLALVSGAALALDSGRSLAAALLCALAFQAKLVPGLVAAAWVRRFRARDVLLAALLAALLVWPYADAGADLWRSLRAYGREWRFNETGFALLALLPGGRQVPARVALVLSGALALLVGFRRVEPAQAGLASVAGCLLLMPSVLPWYALWLLPFLALIDDPRRPLALAALVFTGSVGLAYLVYPGWLAGGVWQVSLGVRALEYGPCVLAALWAARRVDPPA